jgi:hypothetical protein
MFPRAAVLELRRLVPAHCRHPTAVTRLPTSPGAVCSGVFSELPVPTLSYEHRSPAASGVSPAQVAANLRNRGDRRGS